MSTENCCSVSERHGQAEENVFDRGGRLQEGEHGAPVHRGLPRRERSRRDTLQHHQDPSVGAPLLLLPNQTFKTPFLMRWARLVPCSVALA